MLTKAAIEAYHTRDGVIQHIQRIGIELELFCIDNRTHKMLPYEASDGRVSIQTLFDYLKAHEGYEESGVAKTFGLQKGESKIALEPGAQIEFCSAPHETPAELLKELWAYFEVLKRVSQVFDVSWLDVSYFPIGNAADVPLLPNARCEIIDRYWQHTGTLGLDLMRYTTSLHVSLDYDDVPDLANKVERMLLLKPVLCFLAASSRIRQGQDTGVRSFRVNIYQDTDAPRTGTPGAETLWNGGQWTLDGYIDKVLQAPSIFAVDDGTGIYQESAHEAFEASLNEASFNDYLSHLATIYTDLRIRQYLEVRYLDNPRVRLLPGMVLFLYALVYDEAAWQEFKRALPYTLQDVPAILALLNSVSEAAHSYWESRLLQPIKDFLQTLQKRTEPGLAEYLDPLIERVVAYKSHDTLPDMSNEASILEHCTCTFPF